MRTTRILAILAALAVVVAPMAAAAGMGKAGAARSASKASDDAFDANPKREAGLAKAEQRGLFAKWQKDGNRVHGRFVSFNVTGETGKVADFAYRNGTAGYKPIFREITFQDFTRDASGPSNGVRVTGSILRIYGTDGILKMHNNPTAGLRFTNGDVVRDITFLLGPYTKAGATADNNKSLRLDLANYTHSDHAHLVVSGGSIEKTPGSVKVKLAKNATLTFLMHPKGANAVLLHGLVSGLATGRLGASADVVVVDGVPVAQADEVDIAVKFREAKPGKLVFNASGDVAGPRMVVVTVPRADFPEIKNGSIQVKVGGATADLVSQADALTATKAAANVAIGTDTITILVVVPSFSEKEIVVQSASTGTGGGDGGDNGIPGFAPLAALAALGLVAVGLRRRG